jgi:phospholipase A1
MRHHFILSFWLLFPTLIFARPTKDFNETAEVTLGSAPKEMAFSYHRPTYFIFGKDDLKLQFSGKYRLAKSINLYFAYTQTMFWNIYDDSKPFRDTSYGPEVFYRLVDKENNFLTALDVGYLHLSNGKGGTDSRSLDRIFVRANAMTKWRRHFIGAALQIQQIYNEDKTNADIDDYMGYWDLTLFFTNIINNEKQSLDLEVRFFAGKKGYNLDKGGRQIGLIYDFNSDNFNPSIYLQYYGGYAETLLEYNKKVENYRLGLMLSF